MRVKTSVTHRAGRSRSAFIEKAERAYLASLEKTRRDARDLEILNTNAERLNAEAADVLKYQGLPSAAS